jgi:hypothetical protein
MQRKYIQEPFLFEGGFFYDGGDGEADVDKDRKKSKSLWCTYEEDEPCGPSCTFQKFPKDKARTK